MHTIAHPVNVPIVHPLSIAPIGPPIGLGRKPANENIGQPI